MYCYAILTVFITLNALFQDLVIADQPRATLPDGTELLGVSTEFHSEYLQLTRNVDAFYGIPYAEAPVGPLRFKSPVQKKLPLDNPYDATNVGNSCQQPEVTDPALAMYADEMSEDCLFLDVFVPKPTPPNGDVLVWLHGGGFVLGSGQMTLLINEPLPAIGDIITVTLNYRLGPLGFLTTGDDLIPGNLGLRDQQFALKWIHENIVAFGGDPSRVSISGESAGSASVAFQLLSPGSSGYFNNAIMESGSPLDSWLNLDHTHDYYKKQVKALAELVECSQEVIDDDGKLLECLQSAPVDSIIENIAKIPAELFDKHFLQLAPVIDGDFLPKHPLTLLEEGAINGESIIVGTNAEEGTLFFATGELDKVNTPVVNVTTFSQLLTLMVGIDQPLLYDLIKAVYIPDPADLLKDDYDYFKPGSQFFGDYYMMCGQSKFARLASVHKNVFRYTMTFVPSNNFMGILWAGAAHGDELQFVFGSPFVEKYRNITTDDEREMSRKVIKYWSNFAKTGDPNMAESDSLSLPHWPKVTKNDVIYKDLSPTMEENIRFKERECFVLENIIPQLKKKLDELEKLKSERDDEKTKWSKKEDQCEGDECP